MSRVIYYAAMSADGFIADRDGGVDWLEPFDSHEFGYDDFIAGVGSIVMGRTTYEQMLTFGPWPYGARGGLVVSSRAIEGLPAGVRVVSVGDLPGAVRELPSHFKGDIWVVGGGQTARACLDAGLIERIEVYVIPRLLGTGIPLFGGGPTLVELRLVESRAFENGVVRVRWNTRP